MWFINQSHSNSREPIEPIRLKLDFSSIINKPDLIQLDKPYYGYGNPDHALSVLGFCVTTVSWKGKTLRAAFIVIKLNHQKLIGRKTAVAQGMVTLNLDPDPVTDTSPNLVNESIKQVHVRPGLHKDEIETKFPILFSGKLGCINDHEMKLAVDNEVKLVIQPLRPIAFHYQDAVKKELEKQSISWKGKIRERSYLSWFLIS